MLKEVINGLGFDLNHIGPLKTIKRDVFLEGIEKVKSACELFVNPNKSLPLFSMSKMKINSAKSFLGFIKSLLRAVPVNLSLVFYTNILFWDSFPNYCRLLYLSCILSRFV